MIFSSAALLAIIVLLTITFIIFGMGILTDYFLDKELNNFEVIARFIKGLIPKKK